MMVINAQTKILRIIKEDGRALEAIISLSPKFEKLRNPLLRKVIAGRTSIAMACKMGGCALEDFYKVLSDLSFTIDRSKMQNTDEEVQKPAFMESLEEKPSVLLDVRPYIEGGKDPLNVILQKVKEVPAGGVLKITNSFAPTPLVKVLEKKGFEAYIERVREDLVEAYFYLPKKGLHRETTGEVTNDSDWEAVNQKYEYKKVTIDVRELEMPGPMHKILETLESMDTSQALFVYHKRIPVFLIPELKERGYDIRINTVGDAEVHLLIFRQP